MPTPRLRALVNHVAAEERSSPGGRPLGAIAGASVGSPEWMTSTQTAQRPTSPPAGPPTVVAKSGRPYSAAQTAQICEQFRRDGYYFLGPTLEQREVEVLRSAAERKIADPRNHTAGDSVQGSTLFRMFEADTAARDLIVREPFASLAGASRCPPLCILGFSNCCGTSHWLHCNVFCRRMQPMLLWPCLCRSNFGR